MNDSIHQRLARTLDTLPNGFPSTESGIEIEILKKLYSEEDAEIFCDLRLTLESAEDIAARTGRDPEDLSKKLESMRERGLLSGVEIEARKLYRMFPWIFGLYEYQLIHMDREFAELCHDYHPVFGLQFFEKTPQPAQVVPIEQELRSDQESLPYERVSAIIEAGKSFAVRDCLCKKEKRLLDQGCDKPLDVCLAIAPLPGLTDDAPVIGRPISKQEAHDLVRRAEEAGLVHLTSNVQSGHFFICNCCGCCCNLLRSINELGLRNPIRSGFHAEIDEKLCNGCGICVEERCQIEAILETESGFQVDREKCIGCGLCASTCAVGAIQLVPKEPKDRVVPPVDQMEWWDRRAEQRGVDFSRYK